jgi:hypothetical protein
LIKEQTNAKAENEVGSWVLRYIRKKYFAETLASALVSFKSLF